MAGLPPPPSYAQAVASLQTPSVASPNAQNKLNAPQTSTVCRSKTCRKIVKPSAQSQAKKGVADGAGDAEDAAFGPAEMTAEDIDIKEALSVTHDGHHGTGTTAETTVEVKNGNGKRGRGDAVDDYAFERIAADDDGSGTSTAPPPALPPLAAAAPPPPLTAVGTTLQFGIPAATLLAPVPPPPKKKRKTQDEFTIYQKLQILNELKGPHAISIPELAAKHSTSRTSIYRWKNDMQRLQKLARKEGKGAYKRVSAVSKRKNYYNEEFTASEKLAVIRELKGDNAPSVRDMAGKVGANYRSLYRWKRDEARLVKLVEQDGKGECKRARAGDDPLLRVKEALKLFHAKNYIHPAAVGGERPLKTMAVTGTIIATKARQIRDEMLTQNERTPFLTDKEVKGLKDFTGSTSWGRKIVHKFGWKESSNNDDASGTDAANTAAQSAAVSAPTSKTEKHPKPPSSVETSIKGGVKREISLLKKRLHNAIKRANNLEEENAELRAQILLLRNNKNDSAVGFGNGEATTSGRASRLTEDVCEVVNYAAATEGDIDEAAAGAFVDALTADENGVGTYDDVDRHVEL